MNRLSSLQGEEFDVAIIGGGIVGCGIARDAALRGFRVMLVEQQDFGSGTTSASTRIVHGGLRYLEMLDLRLVRLDLRERETLLRIAPHLIKPLEFLIPFFRGSLRLELKMRVGLALYDALSFDKGLPSRKWVSSAELTDTAALRRSDIQSAAVYYDARVDSPERLALENVIDAEAHHAKALNYCKAISVMRRNDRVSGLRVRDLINGTEADVSSRVIVNATGAWFDLVNHTLTSRPSSALRTTKGVHIVCPAITDRALVLFSTVDHRLLFAIPRGGLTWIGTTDTDYAGDPADACATRADVEYLLRSVRHVFPTLGIRDVLFTTAGVRALVRRAGAESSVSRMHRIVDGEPLAPSGIISVLGGKITGYRAISEDVTDIVCKRLGAHERRSVTASTPLPGASADGRHEGLERHLVDLYGARATEVLKLARSGDGLDRQLSPKYPDIAAQVLYSVRHEHCVRLSDFMRRRTLLGGSDDQGWDAVPAAAALMSAELGWSPDRASEEVAVYSRTISAAQSFRNK